MTTPEGLQAVRRIITEGINRTARTRTSLATDAGISPKTMHNVLRSDHTPSTQVLAKLENTLGLLPGVLTDLSELGPDDHPEHVTYDSLLDTTNPVPASDMTDAELLWELTTRLQSQAARIGQLEAQLDALRTQAPTDAYALAADHDRSGVGRHLADQADATGEEPQA